MPIHLLSETDIRSNNNGTLHDGGGLSLLTRKDGIAKSWLFRYNGKRFGEDKGQRISIGSAHKVSLNEARRLADGYREMLARGVSPLQHQLQAETAAEQERRKHLTFREAIDEFYKFKTEMIWKSQHTRTLNYGIRKNYLEPQSALLDRPLQSITPDDLTVILQPIWQSVPQMGKRVQSILFGIFERGQKKKTYFEANPASFETGGDLETLLGKRPVGGHHRDLPVRDVPLLMSYIRTPPCHGPEWCTTSEAAEATGRSKESLRSACTRGLIPRVQRAAEWGVATYLIPVEELVKVFPLQQPLRKHIDIPLPLHILQFIILTAVRCDMAVQLKWDNIKTRAGYINYGKHKTKHVSEMEYLTMLTPGVRAILDAMAEFQKRNNMRTDHVFAWGPSPTGVDHWLNKATNVHAINRHLKYVLERIPEIETKDASVHGLRTTFWSWAADNGYPFELIKITIGHTLGTQADRAYSRNAQYLRQRHEMMTSWETHCLGYAGEAPNVIPLRTLPSNRRPKHA